MDFEILEIKYTWLKDLYLCQVDFDRERLRSLSENSLCTVNRKYKILLLSLDPLGTEQVHGSPYYFFSIENAFFFLGAGESNRMFFPKWGIEGKIMNAYGLEKYNKSEVIKVASMALLATNDYQKSGKSKKQVILDKYGKPIT